MLFGVSGLLLLLLLYLPVTVKTNLVRSGTLTFYCQKMVGRGNVVGGGEVRHEHLNILGEVWGGLACLRVRAH